MATEIRVQILGEALCISHSNSILGKDMNPIILPLAMGKIVGQIELYSLDMITSLGERKL